MRISMLIENQKAENSALKNEHGLSMYIEKGNETILFDTGYSGRFIENAEKMGLNLEKVDTVILSHAHNDHCGGLKEFLDMNKKAKVYISKNARQDFYFKMLFVKEYISVPKEVFHKHGDRLKYVDSFLEITKDVYLFSGVTSRNIPLGKSAEKLLVKINNSFQRDSFDHEQILAVNNGGKLVILTGCSHNGITNMIDTVKQHFPSMPVQAVIGGFHLMGFPFKSILGEPKDYIIKLGKMMNSYNIEKTYTAHCTGDKAYKILKEVMQDRISYMHTGMQIEL
ncbi:MAG: MBL fold metallo-hydrolase [Clostridia bacterium]|nr:MBL fold metallo-hydrolase [Clostridia bacterium]